MQVADRWRLLENVSAAFLSAVHKAMTAICTNVGHDRDQPAPMAKAAKVALGRDDLTALADKGYFSWREILARDEAGITTTVPRPEASGNRIKAT